MWDSKSCGNIPLDKFFHVLFSDIRKGLCLDLHDEIINPDNDPSLVSRSFGNGPTISKPNYAKSHGLDRGFRIPPGL